MAYDIAAGLQPVDVLGAYIKGRMVPMQMQAMQQEAQMRSQSLEQGALSIDQLRQTMALNQQKMGYAQQLANGGTQNGPQASVGNAPKADTGGTWGQQVNGPDSFTTPRVNTMMALDVLNGKDPLDTQKKAREEAMAQAQFQAKGPLDLMKTIAGSPNAARIVMNNPQLMAEWPKIAQQLGLDPVKDFNDANVRQAAAFAHNNIAGSVGLDGIAMPTQLQTRRGPLNSEYQVDPLTGKETQVKAEESLHQVIGSDGQPQLLPASQAAGKQPFNASVFGAANASDQAIQFAADTYRSTGKMPGGMSRNPAMQAKVLERVAQDAQASGDSVGAINARAAGLKASGMALDQNTKLETATTSYLQTMEKNLDNLLEVANKVDSSGSPLINRVYRAWQQGVTGDPEVAKYVTYLNSVQGEFAKLKSGSLGNQASSDSARKEAEEVINKYMSNGQLKALSEAMRQEGNNRLSAIREQTATLRQQLGQNAPGQQSPQAAPTQAAKGAHPDDIQAILKKYGH